MYLMNLNFTAWHIKTYRAKRPVNNRKGNANEVATRVVLHGQKKEKEKAAGKR